MLIHTHAVIPTEASPSVATAPLDDQPIAGVGSNGTSPPVTSYAFRGEFDAWRALTPREQRRILDRIAAAVSAELEQTRARDDILARLRAGMRREGRYYRRGGRRMKLWALALIAHRIHQGGGEIRPFAASALAATRDAAKEEGLRRLEGLAPARDGWTHTVQVTDIPLDSIAAFLAAYTKDKDTP